MQPDTISAFEKFLNYGPIGLAGLMLVLVIVAMTLQKPSDAQYSLLKFFMVVGAVCFLASLAAEFFARQSSHKMTVFVAPNDLGARDTFPAPIIRLNGEVLEQPSFDVSSSGSLIVDVSESVGAFTAVETEAKVKTQELAEVAEVNRDLQQDVERLASEVEVREVALVRAQELSERLISDVAQIRQEAAGQSTQFTPQTQRAIRDLGGLERQLNRTFSIQR